MVDFKNAKIYQIIDNETGKRYVGSTCEPTLAKRFANHRIKYRTWVRKDRPRGKGTCYMTSFEVFETGNEVRIELVEKCDVSSRDELRAREGHFIRELNCVNKHVAGRTMDEWRRLPEHRERANARVRERRATDAEWREKENAAHRTPEYRARQNELSRERRQLPEVKERRNALMRERRATDAEWREKRNAAQRRRREAKRCQAVQAAAAEVETSKINQDTLIEQKREWKQELIRCQTCGGTITKGSFAAHKKTKYCLEAAAAQDDSDL